MCVKVTVNVEVSLLAPLAPTKIIPAARQSTDADLPQCRGAQNEDGLLALPTNL